MKRWTVIMKQIKRSILSLLDLKSVGLSVNDGLSVTAINIDGQNMYEVNE